MKNKTMIIMGGGTSGWVSALYFLNKSKDLNLNLKIKLISSSEIETIGVGEGTTPSFTHFIENICKIDKKEFLKETKGSFKYGVKFNNWNFDGEYYYNLFKHSNNEDKKLIQYCVNNRIPISQKTLQSKLHGVAFKLAENNKFCIRKNDNYAYHFSASLLIPFLKKKCTEFENFEHIEGIIKKISYDETRFISNLKISDNQKISGDFFVNCLGFKSNTLLSNEYFDIENWDNYILNNSAFAIQVKNSPTEIIEPYTTSTSQEYGWSWKIPQYEKTGYGYVYSDHFITDEDKLYNDILKTYDIKEKDVFKTKIVKSKPYFNKKQLHKNCLSLGLSSGFVEPLEATSIHMTLLGLNVFFELIELKLIQDEKDLVNNYVDAFNSIMHKDWRNVFKFIIYHYFTNNPINDYWKHYKKIQDSNVFDFYEKYFSIGVFSNDSYFKISLGMDMKDYYYSFVKDIEFKKNIKKYFYNTNSYNCEDLHSHNDVLTQIHLNNLFDTNSKILNQINSNNNILNYS